VGGIEICKGGIEKGGKCDKGRGTIYTGRSASKNEIR
jgi:hypothetical protein